MFYKKGTQDAHIMSCNGGEDEGVILEKRGNNGKDHAKQRASDSEFEAEPVQPDCS